MNVSHNKVLVLDDEKNITFVIKAILEKNNITVVTENNPKGALELLSVPGHGFSCLITDLFMPEIDGMQILERVKSEQPGLPIIMITAYGTVNRAVESLKNGAFDFITKPFEQGEILAAVDKAIKSYQLLKSEPMLENQEQMLTQALFIGKSQKIYEINKMISKIAPTNSTVLIYGETGSGRDIVASEIFRVSNRSDKQFIKFNCSAYDADQISKDLFGVEFSEKPSKIELSNQGTIFIDEITHLSNEQQAILLKLIQESSIEKKHSGQLEKVDVRFILGTSKNLKLEINQGKFRDDLFYELNTFSITLPSLKERKNDIEDLVYFFVKKSNQRHSKSVSSIESNCMNKLIDFDWPGNLKQLEAEIERAVLLSNGKALKLEDLSDEILNFIPTKSESRIEKDLSFNIEAENVGKDYKDIVKQHTHNIERQIIEKALDQNFGNITKTAERLGLSRKGLQLKLKELGLSVRGAKDTD